jgi:hypothetical protein
VASLERGGGEGWPRTSAAYFRQRRKRAGLGCLGTDPRTDQPVRKNSLTHVSRIPRIRAFKKVIAANNFFQRTNIVQVFDVHGVIT